MNYKKLVAGLLLINAGVFFAIAAFLPHAASYSYSNPIEHFFNARTNWDIAFLATLGSTLVSIGLALLCSFRATKQT
jgi:hypothetical protein